MSRYSEPLIALIALIASACGEATADIRWDVTFEGTAARGGTRFRVRAVESCEPGAPELAAWESAPGEPSGERIERARFSLAIDAVSDCVVYARGCAPIDATQSAAAVEVVLRAVVEEPLCASAACIAGRCETPGTDGGSDGAIPDLDGGPRDAGPRDGGYDAGSLDGGRDAQVPPDSGSSCTVPVAEVCDGVDNDCDRRIDEAGASDSRWFYPDLDNDTYGSSDLAARVRACDPPPQHVTRTGDCDDGERLVNPGVLEACNARDDDCDGLVDDGTCLGFGCVLRYRETSSYLFCTTSAATRTWASASTFCRDRNYRLATIETAAEDQWIDATAGAEASGQRFWHGLYDVDGSASYVWDSGSTATYRNFASTPPASRCASYPAVGSGGAWAADNCGSMLRFVCEVTR